MAQERKIKTREELINEIKFVGQSIIDNADSILGNEKYFLGVRITSNIERNLGNVPTINISRNFIPEGDIESYANEKAKKEEKKDEQKKTNNKSRRTKGK